MNSSHAERQSPMMAGYLPPHLSVNSSKRTAASSGLTAVWTGRRSRAMRSPVSAWIVNRVDVP